MSISVFFLHMLFSRMATNDDNTWHGSIEQLNFVGDGLLRSLKVDAASDGRAKNIEGVFDLLRDGAELIPRTGGDLERWRDDRVGDLDDPTSM